VYQHTVKRLKLRKRDRIFWVWLSRLWSNWRSALAIVQPTTVIKWHRQGFKLYWRWKSKARKPGRPPIQCEIRELLRPQTPSSCPEARFMEPKTPWNNTPRDYSKSETGLVETRDASGLYMRIATSHSGRESLTAHVSCVEASSRLPLPVS